jgi:hypothetical protein
VNSHGLNLDNLSPHSFSVTQSGTRLFKQLWGLGLWFCFTGNYLGNYFLLLLFSDDKNILKGDICAVKLARFTGKKGADISPQIIFFGRLNGQVG